MKKTLYIILFMAIPCLAMAQSNAAYKGGGGDGYASALVQNVSMGIKGKVEAERINIYPNPVSIDGVINVSSELTLIDQITITDMSGKTVIFFEPHTMEYTFKDHLLRQGAYLVRVRAKSEIINHKLIVY